MKLLDKNKKFKLFDMNRDGKGVDPGEDTTPNLKFFFKQFGRKFSKIISANILMIFQVLPIIISVYLYIVVTPKTPTLLYPEYAALFGIHEASSSLISSVNLGLFSYQFMMPAYNTYIYWIIGALMLLLFITFGWQQVGSTYIMRGLVRGDSVFIVSDFFYAIKKNWKQGLILGMIDFASIAVLIIDLLFFLYSEQTPFTNFMYVMTIALIILYVIFRFYTYLMVITFDMKLMKIFKNALIFTALGIKRNVMALLGLAIVTAIAVVPILLLLPVGLGVALVLPCIYYLGVCGFITTYAAYPVIKKYMIDPVDTGMSDDAESDADTVDAT